MYLCYQLRTKKIVFYFYFFFYFFIFLFFFFYLFIFFWLEIKKSIISVGR